MDILLWLLPMLLIIPLLIFWYEMLSHAIKSNIPNKQFWLMFLIVGSLIGAVVYYIEIYRDFN
jgi:ABC-type transport system involved in cytochrome c biogenesis permease component